jgi:hypothetical protein
VLPGQGAVSRADRLAPDRRDARRGAKPTVPCMAPGQPGHAGHGERWQVPAGNRSYHVVLTFEMWGDVCFKRTAAIAGGRLRVDGPLDGATVFGLQPGLAVGEILFTGIHGELCL